MMASIKLILHIILLVSVLIPSLASFIHEKVIEEAPASAFLFAASISSRSLYHGCTGVILNKRWIITSALCITQHSNEPELKVYYGSHNRTHDRRKIAEIERIELHPEFEQRKLRNNLALLKIKADIDFIPTVVEAALLTTKEPFEKDEASVIGWEQYDAEHQSDSIEMLKYQRTNIMPADYCLTFGEKGANYSEALCTHATTDDTLPGLDNGCALISSDGKGLIGVAMWRAGDFPNAFVRIQTHLDWIKSIVFE